MLRVLRERVGKCFHYTTVVQSHRRNISMPNQHTAQRTARGRELIVQKLVHLSLEMLRVLFPRERVGKKYLESFIVQKLAHLSLTSLSVEGISVELASALSYFRERGGTKQNTNHRSITH